MSLNAALGSLVRMFLLEEVIFDDVDIMKKSNIKKVWGWGREGAQEQQRLRRQLFLQALRFLFSVFRREQLLA